MDIDVLKKQLGLRLKELRIAKVLRQEDLDKWDFSYRYYGKLERGMNNPTIETLAKVCEIFGVTLSDLFLIKIHSPSSTLPDITIQDKDDLPILSSAQYPNKVFV